MRFGLLSGAGETFQPALSQRIEALSDGASRMEPVRLGIVSASDAPEYDCIVDRISNRVPTYRAWLRQAVDQQVRVINDPRALERLHGFASLGLLTRKGCPVPKTLLLPQKSYEGVAPAALDHLEYPLDWAAALESLGGVAWLKSALVDAPFLPVRVESVEELLAAYDRAGSLPLILQADIAWDRYVRVFTFGGTTAIVARYDPAYRHYLLDPAYLDGEMGDEIARGALIASRLLKLEVNAVDIAVSGDRWWLIDPLHPHPDLERDVLTPPFFEKVVEAFAQLCLKPVRRAKPEGGGGSAVTGSLGLSLVDLGKAASQDSDSEPQSSDTPEARRRTGEIPAFRNPVGPGADDVEEAHTPEPETVRDDLTRSVEAAPEVEAEAEAEARSGSVRRSSKRKTRRRWGRSGR